MNKICRICLEEGVLSSIFTRNFNISLCDMIEYCCNIKISKNDGLPEQLCSNCAYKLGIAYHFKQTCESADIRLRQHAGFPLNNKNDAAVMTDPIPVPVQTVVRKCKCQMTQNKKSNNSYKKKPEAEKKKCGPKPKPKQIHACYQCDKEFRCQAQLEMHIRTHTGDKPFNCMYCPRSFTQKHNLTIHLRIHTGEKPFQCEICSKRFSAQGNLQTHLKIHTGQRDHTCNLCNKTFITSSDLTRHLCRHRGVKDHKCNVCGAAYVQLRDLKSHKMKKHQIDSAKTEDTNAQNNIDVTQHEDGPALRSEAINLTPDSNDIKQAHQDIPLPAQKNIKGDSNFLSPHDKHTCSICGDQFDFIAMLAQHYVYKHKSYEMHIV